jgi:hypothetical protein
MTMQSQTPGPRRFEIGGVLGAMGTAIGKNPVVFFGMAFLLIGLPTAIFGAVQMVTIGDMLLPGYSFRGLEDLARMYSVVGVGLLVSVVVTFILQAALTHGVVTSLRGRAVSFQECLGVGLRYFLPALLIALCVFVGVAFGLVLLIVPGLILGLGWSVAVPVAVTENRGVFGSIGRSWQLTNGYKGHIFLVFLIYFGIYWVVNLLFSGIGLGLYSISPQAYLITMSIVLGPVVATISAVFQTSITAALYYELRSAKEGIGADDLATIFD